ncbi:hypothetical protein EVAR_32587_1 [Eumeta japonica]|uniref:Uncharacterized protein n=1 Tax=Eumeta variegata TaxID=151549 RepID=A0A4C1VTI4_EUMVA|nr:hypothetical protein EVAR_32587_1 [Eumeta japonica]
MATLQGSNYLMMKRKMMVIALVGLEAHWVDKVGYGSEPKPEIVIHGTINKSQRQTLKAPGVDLRTGCFSHGQPRKMGAERQAGRGGAAPPGFNYNAGLFTLISGILHSPREPRKGHNERK